MIWGAKDQRGRDEHLGGGLGRVGRELFFEIFPIGLTLGRGDVVSGLNEPPELGVGNWGLVDPEGVELDAMNRALIGAGVGVGAAHEEPAGGDEATGVSDGEVVGEVGRVAAEAE